MDQGSAFNSMLVEGSQAKAFSNIFSKWQDSLLKVVSFWPDVLLLSSTLKLY